MLVVALGISARAEAAPVPLHVTADMCGDGRLIDFSLGCPDATTTILDVLFTFEQKQGQYFNPQFASYQGRTDGSFWGIESVTGTLFGQAVTLRDDDWRGESWLYSGAGEMPGFVSVSAGGSNYALFWSGWVRLNADNVGTRILTNWQAVPVPEPTTLALLTSGLFAFALIRRRW
jgi:hypothetical protein